MSSQQSIQDTIINISDDNYIKTNSEIRLNTITNILTAKYGSKWKQIFIYSIIFIFLLIVIIFLIF